MAFASGGAVAIEVELAPKSKPRLDAILELHRAWMIAGKTIGVIYVCGNDAARQRVDRAAERVGLDNSSERLLIKLLHEIKNRTVSTYNEAGQLASRRLRDLERHRRCT